jgi:hypothetical protein
LARISSRLETRITALKQTSSRLGWMRLGVFFGGLALIFVSLAVRPALALATLVAAIIAFALIIAIHRRVDSALKQAALYLKIKTAHAARASLDWATIPPAQPPTQDTSPPPDHPFAHDLDLLGDRSLHRLLDTAVTVEGSDRLRDWLLQTTPDREIVLKRQALVRELIPQTRFRDKLALYGRLSNDRMSDRRWRVAPLPPVGGGSLLPAQAAANPSPTATHQAPDRPESEAHSLVPIALEHSKMPCFFTRNDPFRAWFRRPAPDVSNGAVTRPPVARRASPRARVTKKREETKTWVPTRSTDKTSPSAKVRRPTVT